MIKQVKPKQPLTPVSNIGSKTAQTGPIRQSGSVPPVLPMQTALTTTGVNPQAVFFDATIDSTLITPPDRNGRKVWEEFKYEWNFGDPASGVWSTSNKSKNRAYGYTAAHVYESPGTYTATLTITTDSGASHTYAQIITISDAEVIYSGKTFYVANSGLDTNPGTQASPFASFGKAVQIMFASGGPRRILFKRGDTFNYASYPTPANKTGPFHFGAYGDGAKPIINSTSNGAVFQLDKTCVDTRFVDLDIRGNDLGQAYRPGSKSLILRNNIDNFDAGISTSDAHGLKSEVFLVDSVISNSKRYGVYFNFGFRCAFLGNTFQTITGPQGEHVVRCYISHSVIGHNIFDGGFTAKHQLKFVGYFPTGNGLRDADTPTEAVEFSIICDNTFRNSGPVDWMIVCGPVDQGKDQRIENCLVERNTLYSSGGTQVMLMLNNRWIVARNNIFIGSGTPGSATGIRAVRRGIEPHPNKHFIYNNTFYSASTGNFTCVQVAAGSSDMECVNNLGSAPNSGSASVLSNSGANTVQNANMLLSNAGFANPVSGDFHLTAGSSAINVGALNAVTKDDYDGVARPQGTGVDIGAFEKI